MIIDGRSLPDGETIVCDLAIIGAGAAGITLALALAEDGLSIAVLESGGLDWDGDVQDLYRGSIGAVPYGPLEATRLRMFGGSTMHWGGWCRKLDAIDFEGQAERGTIGWPIAREVLTPYYDAALPLLDLGKDAFDDVAYWESRAGERALALPDERVTTRFFQFSAPTRFGERYRGAMERAGAVRVFLHTNVTAINLTPDGARVRDLSLKRLTGETGRIEARHVVLASGGMENVRLLLNSRDVMREGAANASGLVGRYFSDHPLVSDVARLILFRPDDFARYYASDLTLGRDRIRAILTPSNALRRAEGLLGSLTTVDAPSARWTGAGVREGLGAFAAMPGAIAPDIVRLHARLMGYGADAVFDEFSLGSGLEAEPDPQSRLVLSDDTDPLGMQRLRFDWRLSKGTIDSFHRTLEILAADLRDAGLGLLRINPELTRGWPDNASYACHHLGGTRMGEDAKTSVVDTDQRAHGIGNFWIAGSSVFPTHGVSNPTLTIIAMTLRLADRLRQEFHA